MKYKGLGVVIALIGAVMFFFSMNIMDQVNDGRQRISEGQQQVDTARGLFNYTPVTKEVGRGITSSAQRRIDEGTAEADKYQDLAEWLKIGGIILIVAGAAIAILKKKN